MKTVTFMSLIENLALLKALSTGALNDNFYLLWNVPIQIFFHNFRALKWIPP